MLQIKRRAKFAALLFADVLLQSDHLGGVLSQLRNESNSLQDYLNLFTVTESSTYSGSPERIFNQDDNNAWYTSYNGAQEQWVQIEMKNIYLAITGYILMSYDASPSYPKSWRLEGRNSESEEWKRIDERSCETALDGQKKVKKYMNNILTSCTFRIFRLTQTEDTNGGSNQLGLNEMDFVGESSLFPYVKKKKRCITKFCSQRSPSAFTSFMIMLLVDSSIYLTSKFIKVDAQIKSE